MPTCPPSTRPSLATRIPALPPSFSGHLTAQRSPLHTHPKGSGEDQQDGTCTRVPGGHPLWTGLGKRVGRGPAACTGRGQQQSDKSRFNQSERPWDHLEGPRARESSSPWFPRGTTRRTVSWTRPHRLAVRLFRKEKKRTLLSYNSSRRLVLLQGADGRAQAGAAVGRLQEAGRGAALG